MATDSIANNEKFLKKAIIKLISLFQGMFFGGLISVLPVLLTQYKNFYLYLQNIKWSVLIFFFVSIATGSIFYLFRQRSINNKAFLILIYLFLYTSCTALCQRLDITTILTNSYQDEAISIYDLLLTVPGLILICLSAMHLLLSHITIAKNINSIKQAHYSYYLSWLLFMGGVPLIFGVWLPLLAIPGALVMTKWLD